MKQFGNVKVLFIAGFGPIVRDAAASRGLYNQNLGISFKEESGGYLHTETLKGAKTFALWPLTQVAQSCFGEDSWPDDIPVPQAWLEFDVDSVEKATAELESQGYQMLVKSKQEPWGQTVSRFIGPEGLLVGITFTPLMPTGERQIRGPFRSPARSAGSSYQGMKPVTEGEDRSCGRDSNPKAAKESTLLEPYQPSSPWKGSVDPLVTRRRHSRW